MLGAQQPTTSGATSQWHMQSSLDALMYLQRVSKFGACYSFARRRTTSNSVPEHGAYDDTAVTFC